MDLMSLRIRSYVKTSVVLTIVASALTLGESEFLKALDIETPNPPS